MVAELPLVGGGDHKTSASVGIDWCRFRAGPTGAAAAAEVETTYVPAAVCLPDSRRRRQVKGRP